MSYDLDGYDLGDPKRYALEQLEAREAADFWLGDDRGWGDDDEPEDDD